MQIVEASVIGLRAARIRLTQPDGGPEVTLFPMVHVGEAGFFAQVYAEAAGHDAVLLEGVASPVVTNLTRSYRWMRVGRLDLAVQPRFDPATTKGEVIRADLSGPEFDAIWRRVPRWQRALFAVTAPAVGVGRGLGLSRTRLARGMNQDDLTSREDIFAWDGLSRHLRAAILDARDARVCEVLLKTVASTGKDRRIAVIYGAAHMPAILRGLQQQAGYVAVDSDWMTVFPAQ